MAPAPKTTRARDHSERELELRHRAGPERRFTDRTALRRTRYGIKHLLCNSNFLVIHQMAHPRINPLRDRRAHS